MYISTRGVLESQIHHHNAEAAGFLATAQAWYPSVSEVKTIEECRISKATNPLVTYECFFGTVKTVNS